MKILLIKPLEIEYTKKSFFSEPKKKVDIDFQVSYSPPIGLLYVARSIEDEGHTVELIDFYHEENPEEKIKKMLTDFDAVGISVFTFDYDYVAHIAKLIKDADSDFPIIIGGPHCTFIPGNSLNEVPSADVSIEGDGEFAIKDVLKSLEGTKKLSDIPGVRYRDGDEIKNGKPAELIMDLDSIAFPSRHLVEKYDYGKVKNFCYRKPKFTSLVSSRGCPFQCKFCTRHFSIIKTYRQRSADNFVKEIEEINDKYGSAVITDDNFLTDTKRVHKMMDKLIEIGSDLELYIYGARVDKADRELYLKMRKAGVKDIFFGIESGSQEILDYYNKNITLEQIRKSVNLSKEMDFTSTGSFILGAPIETKEHIKQTINFSKSLPLDIVLFRPLIYKYGSDLWIEAVKDGKINESDGYRVLADSKKGLGNFTYDELDKTCSKATTDFYVRPSYIFRQLSKAIRKKDFSLIKIGLDYL